MQVNFRNRKKNVSLHPRPACSYQARTLRLNVRILYEYEIMFIIYR